MPLRKNAEMPELTARQEQVLELMVRGMPLKEIENLLGLASGSAKQITFKAYDRLGPSKKADRRLLLFRWWTEHRGYLGTEEATLP